MILRIDPTVDYAFRRIFGREVNQISLIALINAVLQEPPEHCVTAREIRNPFQDKDFLEDKLSVLDIKARDASGRQFNVEMQMLASEIFRHRAAVLLGGAIIRVNCQKEPSMARCGRRS